MTDDNNSRYRSSDPFSAAPAGQGSSDPLAELARLIGKNDPFSELGRVSQAPAAPQPERYHADHHDDLRRYASPEPPQPFPPSGGWDATARPAPEFDPFAPHAPLPPMTPEQRYEDHPYAAGPHAHAQPQPVIDTYRPEEPAHFDPLLGAHSGYDNENGPRMDEPRMGDVPGFGPPPFHPSESGAAQASEDQFYDDAPPRRRKGLVTVAAVLGLAVIGTAGAFGYRSYVSSSGGSLSLPPVIRASTEPNKVAPPPPQQTADASKISYDRFGDRGQNEKVVTREEQPVDQREIARSSSVPRTVLPGAPVPSANPPSALGEPKRIRTVPIRPDQADASASAASASSVMPKQQMAAFPPPPQSAPQQILPAAPQPAPMETAPAPPPQRAAAQPAPAPRPDRKSTRLNSSHIPLSRMPSSA